LAAALAAASATCAVLDFFASAVFLAASLILLIDRSVAGAAGRGGGREARVEADAEAEAMARSGCCTGAVDGPSYRRTTDAKRSEFHPAGG